MTTMSGKRRALSATLVLGAGSLLVLLSCLSPTQLVLELRTDLACNTVKGVTITVGAPSRVESAPPNTTTLRCSDGYIGTIAVAPASDNDGRIAIRAVLGVDVPAEECTAANKYQGCIVVRRQLSFVPRTSVPVLIGFYRACLDVPCDGDSTCKEKNRCVPSSEDPGKPTGDAGVSFGDGAAPECDVKESCPVLPTSPPGCAEARCENKRCRYFAKDEDNDFDLASSCTSSTPGVSVVVGTDCDDKDPSIRGGVARECTTSPEGKPLDFPPSPLMGTCKKGMQACDASGKPGPCVGAVGRAAEVCGDLLDNNCNGAVDEGCACSPDGAVQACGSVVGVCKNGMQTCNASTWGACIGAIGPFPRDCASTADNDCNGKADATLDCVCRIGDVVQCQTGLAGACAIGKSTCVADGSSSTSKWGPCVPNGAPQAFDCSNNLDNDCNGTIDSDELVTLQPPDDSHVCANLYRCPGGSLGQKRFPVCRDSGSYKINCGAFVGGGTTSIVGYAPIYSGALPGRSAQLYVTSDKQFVYPRDIVSKCCANGICPGSPGCDSSVPANCTLTSLPLP